MCFTPIISLLTALLEFSVALFILIYYKKSSLSKTIILFIFLLGLYQFTEYMVCTSNSQVLWAKIGFITYTFLPAVGLDFCLKHFRKKHNYLFVFIIPVIFSLFAVLKDNFIIESTCGTYFVVIKHLFFDISNMLPLMIYLVYYFGFIFFVSYLFIRHYKKTHSVIKKKIDVNILIGIFVSLVPAVILLVIFPTLSVKFPSIYCQFAVIFTVSVLIGFHLEKKGSKRFKN